MTRMITVQRHHTPSGSEAGEQRASVPAPAEGRIYVRSAFIDQQVTQYFIQ